MDGEGNPRRHTREDSGLTLDRHGQWWHDGQPVEHPKIIETFNRGLVPTEDGRYQLHVGADWCFVQVEDAAYRVLLVDQTAKGLLLSLTDRTSELLSPVTLSLDAEGVFTCRVKDGRAKARFSRDAQFALGSLIALEGDQPVLPAGPEGQSVPVARELFAADSSG